MGKYRVIMRQLCYYELEVEAENYDDAVEIAYETDGAYFTELPYMSEGWNIESVEEM